jgi:lysozyme
MSNLVDQLKFEEGLRLRPYRCTAGYLTIGYGRNIDSNPYFNGRRIPSKITKQLAEEILLYDIADKTEQLRSRWPSIKEFSQARQDACINMAFQLGVNGFMKFERMRAALLARDWQEANKQALNSNWARQTPERARRVAGQILTGEHYEIPS